MSKGRSSSSNSWANPMFPQYLRRIIKVPSKLLFLHGSESCFLSQLFHDLDQFYISILEFNYFLQLSWIVYVNFFIFGEMFMLWRFDRLPIWSVEVTSEQICISYQYCDLWGLTLKIFWYSRASYQFIVQCLIWRITVFF